MTMDTPPRVEIERLKSLCTLLVKQVRTQLALTVTGSDSSQLAEGVLHGN